MNYILHIGRNKTGTSALQNFLFLNQENLKRFGVIFPRNGMETRNTHGLARTHHKLARHVKNNDIDSIKKQFFDELSPFTHAIISSEVFHTISEPSRAAQLFGPSSTKVVIYIREYISYLASWYQQHIHSTNSTIRFEDFIYLFDASNVSLIDKWSDVFGHKNVIVRLYDKDKLIKNDIIPDFFSASGLDWVNLSELDNLDNRHINPSIAGNLLFFKRVINQFISKEESQAIVSEIASLTKLDVSFQGKISVSKELAKKINFRYRYDRVDLKKKYGLLIPKSDEPIMGCSVPDLERLSEDWLRIVEYSRDNNFQLVKFVNRLPFG